MHRYGIQMKKLGEHNIGYGKGEYSVMYCLGHTRVQPRALTTLSSTLSIVVVNV
mgnify:CR=1 FL=1